MAPEVRLVVVPEATAAERMRFLGSPTIRVNGRDVVVPPGTASASAKEPRSSRCARSTPSAWRAPAEYEDDHLPGAINRPLKQFAHIAPERLERDRPVIVYCHDTI